MRVHSRRRYYTQKRLNRASKKLGIPELIVYDQFEDRRVGLRFCTFVTRAQDLGRGVKVRSPLLVEGIAMTGSALPHCWLGSQMYLPSSGMAVMWGIIGAPSPLPAR